MSFTTTKVRQLGEDHFSGSETQLQVVKVSTFMIHYHYNTLLLVKITTIGVNNTT